MQTKKGFILIYTLLVGIICLIVMMYVFDIQMSEVEYSTMYKRDVLRDDNYQRDKEYLTTLFYAYINEVTNKRLISKGIDTYFKTISGAIVSHDTANVSYFKDDKNFKVDNFIFKTRFIITNEQSIVYGYRNDYYKLENADNGFNLIFIETKYTNN